MLDIKHEKKNEFKFSRYKKIVNRSNLIIIRLYSFCTFVRYTLEGKSILKEC